MILMFSKNFSLSIYSIFLSIIIFFDNDKISQFELPNFYRDVMVLQKDTN